ncbi:hypothetical protein [Actinomadura litoris]|uniref:Uncharacterized protein n=1 Tax=Actinomadura litoris TaxID=2678616 RepID=A0A7K1L9J4_9ACTN|nr:hypothetical protein [Actinomadura litoris]MUN40875.1 hypothetical protein [Actinomadura litoris]
MAPELSPGRIERLALDDLFPRYECTYPYYSPTRDILAVKHRFQLLDMVTGKAPRDDRDTKTFSVQHRVENGWAYGIGPYASVAIYGLPTAIKAKARGRTIYYPEGEKDARNMKECWDVCAVAHYQGGNPTTPEQAELLAGSSSRIVLVRDVDLVGAFVAWENARALLKAGQPADLICFARPALDIAKADVSDHIEAGLDKEDLIYETPLEVARLRDEYVARVRKSGRRRSMGSEGR